MRITLSVNGEERSSEIEPRRLLVHYLRDDLGLTGTNVGCDTSSCGACTVLLDGESVKSCTMLAVQADGREVTTIEGLAATAGASNGDATLHPMQQAFHTEHGLQCGFCTPGMVMAAVSLLAENPHPSEEDVRVGLEGNLCRCTGYHNIVRSVLAAADGVAGDDRKRGAGMTATDETTAAGRSLRAAPPAQGGRPAAHRRGPLRRRPRHPGGALARHGAQPVRPRPHRQHRRQRRAGHARRPPGADGRGPERLLPVAHALRLAGHGRHEGARALADRHRQGLLRGRHRGGRWPTAATGWPRGRRRGGRLRPAPGRVRPGGGRGDSVVIHDALGTNRSYTWRCRPTPPRSRPCLRAQPTRSARPTSSSG